MDIKKKNAQNPTYIGIEIFVNEQATQIVFNDTLEPCDSPKYYDDSFP